MSTENAVLEAIKQEGASGNINRHDSREILDKIIEAGTYRLPE